MDTLYLKIDENVGVHDRRVFLKDIAQISCSNKEIEARVKTMLFPEAVGREPGRYVKSVMEVIACIQKEFPSLEINNIGVPDFIITYEKQKQPADAVSWLKTAAVCVLCFFGASFSIMTFNNDVSITELFGQVYELFTGQTSDGFTVLELSYSLGLGLGIIVFFNHFAGKKLTADPTPLEVQMRTYENDVNDTIIEASRHVPKNERKTTQSSGKGITG
ncbi:MAG: stage V sporulation protein AA [Marvinbryantia sp.]|uniref:stage V sporulation protein AA n=1 Tax=Marvinbryantia sp. TaxID=2496532 RepID=UPI0025FBEB88|nr:stage V sporulation protein AA [uncultured Marvinbryantia sp.]